MITVYQGETGGYVTYAIASTIPATSGYLDALPRRDTLITISGFVASGYLYVDKAGISSLAAGYYVALPQVLDAAGERYFLTPGELIVRDV